MADLDALVSAARAATVRREIADAYVRGLDRFVAPRARARPWLWLAPALAAAAVVAAVLVRSQPDAPPSTTARIGDRVAIVVEPGTAYRVVEASAGATTIEVQRGAVTARLWPGAAPHQLVIAGAGAGATARATGTILRLAVDGGRASVDVAEGTVEVSERGEVQRVGAGTAWHGPHRVGAAVDELLAMPAPAPAPLPPPPPVVVVAPPAPPPPPTHVPARVAPSPAPPPVAVPIKDRWRDARLLRGQGHFAEAVAACVAIADTADPIWAPIALVEAIRIEAGPLAAPERAVALADRMLREWSRDPLAGEVKSLRCQALSQLGRACDN